MPPDCRPVKEPALIIPYQEARTDQVYVDPRPACPNSFQGPEKAHLEAPRLGCKASEAHGVSTRSLEGKGSRDSSIIAIVCIVIVLCIAGFVKWKQSWATTTANEHSLIMETHDPTVRRESPKDERHQHGIRRHPKRQYFSARATTDLSGQQIQLRERLDERLAQHQTYVAQQRTQELQASMHKTRLRTPEPAHRRHRERIWEQYQLRSNPEVIAGLGIAGPTSHPLPFYTEEDDTSSIVQGQPFSEPLPAYAWRDPREFEDQSTLYTSDTQFRRAVSAFCRSQPILAASPYSR
ncbi:MAG: hypothetical protein LQ337_005033 [Flavoplaca oasis]|nr:MAG: hypothetical protein LQ337_005033 [Flavoplaca oasis]